MAFSMVSMLGVGAIALIVGIILAIFISRR